MANYTNLLNLYLPNRLDEDVEVDTSLASNFAKIDQAFGGITGNSVKGYGAVGNGVTNDTQAFINAMNDSPVVRVPEGTYIVDGLQIPSNTKLVGEGFGSIIKLSNSAPEDKNLVTNSNHSSGNSGIVIEDLTLDYNIQRFNGVYTDIAGEPNASCLMLINADDCVIRRVKAINGRRHCFDVSSSQYHNDGDSPTQWESDGCNYILFDSCIATGSGDDLFTMHFSNNIWVRNCRAYSPSGVHFANISGSVVNSNGFEVDDGCRYVTIDSCYAYQCARGFESKSHDHSPSPQNIKFVNCVAFECIRGYDFRHDGHLLSTEPTSLSAYHIDVTNCTAISPRSLPIYPTLSVHALIVGSYRGVNITNFTAMNLDNRAQVTEEVVNIRYKANRVNITNMLIKDFEGASIGLRFEGGSARSSRINASNISIWDSGMTGIAIGGDITDWSIMGAIVTRATSAVGSVGFSASTSGSALLGLQVENYETIAKINSVSHNSPPNIITGGLVAGSIEDSLATGLRSAVLSSGEATRASGQYSTAISARNSDAQSTRSTILSSWGVIAPTGNTVTGGYSSTTKSSANRKWQLNSETGTINATGTITGSATFSDYAEYFETIDGEVIETGYIVTLDGDKIRLAMAGDYALGVISETAGVVLGEASFGWSQRFLRNDFGGLLKDEHGEPVENPDYVDLGEEYKSRADRPEWHVVGLLGQVYIRVAKHVKEGDTIVPSFGLGFTGDSNWKVMKITKEFDEEKGYAVALVLIR